MAHIKIEIDADIQEFIGAIDGLKHHDNVRLNEDSLNIVRKDLLNFVHRVASSTHKSQGEMEVLPAVAELLLRQFRS